MLVAAFCRFIHSGKEFNIPRINKKNLKKNKLKFQASLEQYLIMTSMYIIGPSKMILFSNFSRYNCHAINQYVKRQKRPQCNKSTISFYLIYGFGFAATYQITLMKRSRLQLRAMTGTRFVQIYQRWNDSIYTAEIHARGEQC